MSQLEPGNTSTANFIALSLQLKTEIFYNRVREQLFAHCFDAYFRFCAVSRVKLKLQIFADAYFFDFGEAQCVKRALYSGSLWIQNVLLDGDVDGCLHNSLLKMWVFLAEWDED